jgi:hypothetical protein
VRDRRPAGREIDKQLFCKSYETRWHRLRYGVGYALDAAVVRLGTRSTPSHGRGAGAIGARADEQLVADEVRLDVEGP